MGLAAHCGVLDAQPPWERRKPWIESRTVARAACIGSWLGGCAMLPFHLQGFNKCQGA
jgi:hypothetical protein